jgi:hypothetical protein
LFVITRYSQPSGWVAEKSHAPGLAEICCGQMYPQMSAQGGLLFVVKRQAVML